VKFMRIFRAIAAVAFFAVLSAGSALAQPKPTSTPAPTTSGPIPESKIALIDSAAFGDEKQGIARLVTKLKQLNSEFQPRQTELDGLKQQIQKATDDLAKVINVQSQQANQAAQDRIDQMKKDYQRKGEDATAAYNKKFDEYTGPVYEDIGKALDAFAKTRGITMIFDVRKMVTTDANGNQQFPLLYAAPNMDITLAFITDYNSKNPATASTTPSRP